MPEENLTSLEEVTDRLDRIIKLLEEQNRLLKSLTRGKQPYSNKTGQRRG